MRHSVYGKKLNRTRNERAGLFKSLIQSLFTYGTITTSQAKASAIKGTVDKIINLAKDEQVLSNRNKNSQRLLRSYFANKLLQERLIKEITPKLQNRVSGYTSQVKIGVREGDRTTLVKMSLIGLENLKPLEKKSSEKALTRETKKPVTKTKGRTGQSVRKAKSTKRENLRLSK